ncbi:MAG TPA: Flp family type IVb pilin [Xanthobacteraceae bacterium]|nr:Flp family type IVb pilin [Xanthobacteraceae bacterium]
MNGRGRRFFRDEAGAVIVEYALIVAGVSVAIIGALWGAGMGLRDTFTILASFFASAGR